MEITGTSLCAHKYHIFNDFQNIASKLGSNSKLHPSDFVEIENLYSCVMNIFQVTITAPPEISRCHAQIKSPSSSMSPFASNFHALRLPENVRYILTKHDEG